MGTSKNASKINDQYFTPSEFFKDSQIKISKFFKPNDVLLEPCVGSGAFVKALSNYHWITNDLYPQNSFKPDYQLDFKTDYHSLPKVDGVITNPPFGHASSLAFKFLKNSLEIAPTVAMVLPRSLGRDTGIQRMKEYGFLYHHYNLNYVNFITSENKIKKVGCVWQIWGNDKSKSLYPTGPNNFLDSRTDLLSEGSNIYMGLWGDGCAGKILDYNPEWKEVLGLDFKSKEAKDLFMSINWKQVAKNTASSMLRLTKKQVISFYNKKACEEGLQDYSEDVNYFSLECATS